MITDSFLKSLEQIYFSNKGESIHITSAKSLSGGSINDAYHLQCDNRDFFLKCNNATKYPDMFECEAKGLKLLKETNTMLVPEVILTGESQGKSFIMLQMLTTGKRVKNFFQDFGSQLAALHKNHSAKPGLDHHNYIGSLPQDNTEENNLTEFFIHRRLQPLVEMALSRRLIDTSEITGFEKLYKKLPEILPDEPPSLIHGDLWSGNYLCGPDGKAWVIDPAVYYGLRESDLAMARLFGGFDESFFESYNEAFPLERGWKSRVDILNLYPLLVHLNLFGRGYWGQIRTILNRF